MFAALMLALAPAVAFPSPGAKLPNVEHVYLIGAVARGDTNVVVNGRNVDVYRTGAWATLVDVSEGSNCVSVASQAGETTNVCFTVARKPVATPGAGEPPAKVWKKLDYAKDTPREPPAGKAPREITIVVDPGHGGDDTGAKSPHGFFEKDANLLLSECLKSVLAARGYNVVMTRETDVFIPLYDRPKAAHANNADAFVSIHHNAPPCDKDPNVLRYHTVYSWNPLGEALATAINAKMADALGETLRSNGPMHANFAVTRNPEIPSCLVEADFVTSPAGEEAVWNAARRRLVAEAIADGIADWCAHATKEEDK